jgi:hypothetical protein
MYQDQQVHLNVHALFTIQTKFYIMYKLLYIPLDSKCCVPQKMAL